MKTLTRILATLAGLVALNVPSKAHAETQIPKTQIVQEAERDPWLSTGDFVSLADYSHDILLTPESKENISKYVIGPGTGEFVDTKQTLRNVIQWLKESKRAKEFYSQEQRKFLIGRYNGLLTDVEKNGDDLNSRNILNNSVRADNVLDAKTDGLYSDGKWNVKPGIYAFIVRGKKGEPVPASLKKRLPQSLAEGKSDWSYPVFFDIKTSELANGKAFSLDDYAPEGLSPEYVADELKKRDEENLKKKAYDVVSVRENLGIAKPKSAEVKENAKAKGKNLWSVVAGVNGGNDFGEFLFGAKYEPVEGIGVAAVGRYGIGSDKIISELTTPTSPSGIYGYGKIEEKNRNLIGVGAELHVGNPLSIIMGLGVKGYNSTEKTTEDLMRNGEVIKPNSYSKAESEVSGFVNTGLEYKLGSRQDFGLGFNVDLPFSSKQKPSVGIRGSYRLNNRK